MNQSETDNETFLTEDLTVQSADEIRGGSDEQKKRSIHIYTATPAESETGDTLRDFTLNQSGR